MKFLIIRFSSIGDIVLMTPVFRCIRQQLPGAEIHFLCKKSFKAVTEHNPHIDRFFYYDKNLGELKQVLKEQHYDYVIDLHKNFRSYRIRMAIGGKQLAFQKQSVEKWMLTKLGINRMSGRHITLRSLDAVRPLGITDDGLGLEYYLGPYDEKCLERLPLSHAMGYIGLVIGASYETKKLPVHQLIRLCQNLAYPLVLLGGPEDRPIATAIAATDPVKIFNACGGFSLNESAALVKHASLIISHDTGLQYIACAFQKPVLAIWGGTSPLLDVEPYYGFQQEASLKKALYKNFMVPGLTCQPCSNFGTRQCPKKHFNCMEKQDVEAMARLALEWLGLKA